MIFEWDEIKNNKNRAKHGIDFIHAYDFGWGDALLVNRSRDDDGEQRYGAIGYFIIEATPMKSKLHTVIFTKRNGNIRIISIRRANKFEEKIYENKKP